MPSRTPVPPAPKKLALKRETLRRLTPAELRLAAGGGSRVSYPCATRAPAP